MLSDTDLRALDLASGEADLLEEIMSMKTLRPTEPSRFRAALRHRRKVAIGIIVGSCALTGTAYAVVSSMASNRGTQNEPIEISDARRSAALAQCAADLPDVTGVVDSRTGGMLVGVLAGDVSRTCLLAKDGSAVSNVGPTLPGGTATPLLAETSATRPISVIDAKAPDGNMIDGNEMTWVWGRVDPSIARIVVSTPAGTYTPTITDGVFAAWWPGNDGDRTVVHGYDLNESEIAFVDQLSCSQADPVDVIGVGLVTPIQPRLVVNGSYVEGGCAGGEDAEPGSSPNDFDK